jgi:glucose-6-phosphate isomerase
MATDSGTIAASDAWKALEAHVGVVRDTQLKDMLKNRQGMVIESELAHLDFTRSKVTTETMEKLFALAKTADVEGKRAAMFDGTKINETEGRAVLHTALRKPAGKEVMVDGKDVVKDVHEVRSSIRAFVEKVRSGEHIGVTGKALKTVICIGIGGSFLGVEFVHEALRTDDEAMGAASGRQLRFLANVDPIDVRRALDGVDPETALVIVISKTFTTAETMLNARTVRKWLIDKLGPDAVQKQMIACSTALEKTKAFGIDDSNVFGFWDWVGGRFSVCSAVGVLPLSLQYGSDIVQKFLDGAHAMDEHFMNTPMQGNLPMIMGLLTVWNASFMGYEAHCVVPYCQALLRFVAHIQQLDMESNGKSVAMNGESVPFKTGQIHFGEPGTNGQHSFYQLLHQGRAVPMDFIGFKESQNPVFMEGEPVSNHDELMSNFFAQPDALALGKTAEQLKAEGVPDKLVAHKTFSGDRPSLSILMPVCNASWLGQLLAMYEHRTAVQGWLWDVNSFDQWGVQLGKVLATEVRKYMEAARKGSGDSSKFVSPTAKLLQKYMEG